MARKRAFDRDETLDRAMRVFWRDGYAATTIDELVKATGVNRASMYDCFGGKQELFLEAVDRYVHETSARRLGTVDHSQPAPEVLRSMFIAMMTAADETERRLGCFLTNCAVELASSEPSVRARVEQVFSKMQTLFRETIERGQAAGEIPAECDAEASAAMLLSVLQGLRVLARSGRDPAQLEFIADTAIATLRG